MDVYRLIIAFHDPIYVAASSFGEATDEAVAKGYEIVSVDKLGELFEGERA